MNKLYCLVLGLLVLTGCGCELGFPTGEGESESFSGEEAEMAALESADGDSVTADITLQVGAQILEANFMKYRDVAYDREGNFYLHQRNDFVTNLERLYNDVEESVE